MKVIAGPCVIENIGTLEVIAEKLVDVTRNKDIDFYLKGSCVKDNRTDAYGYRGEGFQTGIEKLLMTQDKFKCKITTDFHTMEQLETYGKYVDLIQIPAYLAKQTSLLKVAAETGKPIHVKKPQFIGPEETRNIVNNLKTYGCSNGITLTDRGTMLGYDKVFMDPRHVHIMKRTNTDVLCDVTHPNKNYPYNIVNVLPLAMSYVAAGADGIFLETHPNPESALCDSETMYPLNKVYKLIERTYEIYKLVNHEPMSLL